jgi:hypothetical protein
MAEIIGCAETGSRIEKVEIEFVISSKEKGISGLVFEPDACGIVSSGKIPDYITPWLGRS